MCVLSFASLISLRVTWTASEERAHRKSLLIDGFCASAFSGWSNVCSGFFICQKPFVEGQERSEWRENRKSAMGRFSVENEVRASIPPNGRDLWDDTLYGNYSKATEQACQIPIQGRPKGWSAFQSSIDRRTHISRCDRTTFSAPSTRSINDIQAKKIK